MKKLIVSVMLILILGIISACGSNDGGNEEAGNNSSDSEILTWASGAQGGGWYTTAGGISSLIKDETNINISTIPGGSMQNMPFVATNEAQLAWMQAPF